LPPEEPNPAKSCNKKKYRKNPPFLSRCFDAKSKNPSQNLKVPHCQTIRTLLSRCVSL
jgi:hypothetical protein